MRSVDKMLVQIGLLDAVARAWAGNWDWDVVRCCSEGVLGFVWGWFGVWSEGENGVVVVDDDDDDVDDIVGGVVGDDACSGDGTGNNNKS